MKRRISNLAWRMFNPLVRGLAGVMPWWVLLETTGRRTGMLRRTPLAKGPCDEGEVLLIAVQGRSAAWVRNIEACAQVRVRHRGRWIDGCATVEAFDPRVARRFNIYARSGLRMAGSEPLLVRIKPQR